MIKQIISKHLPEGAKIFVFGSSIKSGKFGDIDVGVKGEKLNESELLKAKEELEESLIPYKVDLINFNKVGKKFEENVFNDDVLWLT